MGNIAPQHNGPFLMHRVMYCIVQTTHLAMGCALPPPPQPPPTTPHHPKQQHAQHGIFSQAGAQASSPTNNILSVIIKIDLVQF